MYFDSSATAKINKISLEKTFKKYDHFLNSNSKHLLGLKSKSLIEDCENTILQELALFNHQIIFTSGASEANNMIILAFAQEQKRRTIIISPFEHNSVLAPVSYLQRKGFKIKIAPIDSQGKINENKLLEMIDTNVCLVSIAACESELGIKQSVNHLAKKIKKIDDKVLIHSDITQAISKYKSDYSAIDFLSFSGHKFGSLKGIGALIKKENIKIRPIMYGSQLRPGTKPVELIYNMTLSLLDINYDNETIINYNNYIRKQLSCQSNIFINSFANCDPHILNISIINKENSAIVKVLSANNIFLSSQSACSNTKESKTIYKLFHSHKRAQSSIRISLSKDNTWEEINLLVRNIRRLR